MLSHKPDSRTAMKTVVLIALIFFLCSNYCSNCKLTSSRKKIPNLSRKPKLPKFDFSEQKRTEQFLLALQSFEAFNLQKKYELGKLVAMIIKSSKFEDDDGATVKKLKINYEAEAVVEPDVIDMNPEGSWRVAESYMKAYKEKGWGGIKTPLRSEPVYVRSKVIVRAITNEEVSLVKRLLKEKYTYVTIERYNYAVRKYKEKGTDKCEEIIDFIEKNNPELGAAVSMRDKLQSGWDQIKVHEYIYENNYPMLRRALDEGFDHDFVFENRGSLLAFSVVARCARCVKMLIERGADVNAPILLDDVVRVKGWDKLVAIEGWTPLMFAVADGNIKIVTELIESGSALVSKTGNGKEGERFHAREAARRIENNNLKKEVLNILKLSSSEFRELNQVIKDQNFIKAIEDNNFILVDIFLLIRSNLTEPLNQNLEIKSISEEMGDVLYNEEFKWEINQN